MGSESIGNVANSYLDFSGLARLRGEAHRETAGAGREVARQFEAMFVQMMMKSMREASFKSDLFESNAMETYESMHDKELAVQMARRGALGIADLLERQMQAPQRQPVAAEELAAREGAGGQQALPLQAPSASYPLARSRGEFSVPRAREDGFSLNRDMPLAPPAAPTAGQ